MYYSIKFDNYYHDIHCHDIYNINNFKLFFIKEEHSSNFMCDNFKLKNANMEMGKIEISLPKEHKISSFLINKGDIMASINNPRFNYKFDLIMYTYKEYKPNYYGCPNDILMSKADIKECYINSINLDSTNCNAKIRFDNIILINYF